MGVDKCFRVMIRVVVLAAGFGLQAAGAAEVAGVRQFAISSEARLRRRR